MTSFQQWSSKKSSGSRRSCLSLGVCMLGASCRNAASSMPRFAFPEGKATSGFPTIVSGNPGSMYLAKGGTKQDEGPSETQECSKILEHQGGAGRLRPRAATPLLFLAENLLAPCRLKGLCAAAPEISQDDRLGSTWPSDDSPQPAHAIMGGVGRVPENVGDARFDRLHLALGELERCRDRVQLLAHLVLGNGVEGDVEEEHLLAEERLQALAPRPSPVLARDAGMGGEVVPRALLGLFIARDGARKEFLEDAGAVGFEQRIGGVHEVGVHDVVEKLAGVRGSRVHTLRAAINNNTLQN